MRLIVRQVLCVLLFTAASLQVPASPGQIDPSFGTNGFVRLDFGAAYSVRIDSSARQADGKIVVAGVAELDPYNRPRRGVVIGRINTDGSLDASFGTNGWTLLTFNLVGYDELIARATAVQSDGKIVVALQSDGGIAAARVLADGSVDNGFAQNHGILSDSQSYGYTPRALAITADGKYLIAGVQPGMYGQPGRAFVFRYSSNFQRDYNFGLNNGWTANDGSDSGALALAVDNYGSIFVGGYVSDFAGSKNAAVWKLTSYGDNDFSFNRIVADHAGFDDWVGALALDSYNRLVIGGRAGVSATQGQFLVMRADAYNGNPDYYFGASGKAVVDVPVQTANDADASVRSIVLGADYSSDITVGGTATQLAGGDTSFALARVSNYGMPVSWFGNNGVVVGPIASDADALTGLYATSDGHLAAVGARSTAGVGRALQARFFDAGGQADTSFGVAGSLAYDWARPSVDEALDFGLYPDGRILVLGAKDFGAQAVLARFFANGALDPSFGDNGVMRAPPGRINGSPVRLLVQPDGRFIIAGYVGDSGSGVKFDVMRFNADGTRDMSWLFGNDAIIRVGPGDQYLTSAALYPDGRVAIAGYAWVGGQTRVAIARFNADGTSDTTFNGYGSLLVDRGVEDYVASIAIQPDGAIVIGGQNNAGRLMVMRVTAAGALDTTFGTGGVAIYNTIDYSGATSIALQADGRIVAAGECQKGNGYRDFCAARFSAIGVFETAFRLDLSGAYGVSSAVGVAVQANGKVILAGDADPGSELTTVRFRPDGNLDAAFNGNGIGRSGRGGIAKRALLQPDGNLLMLAESFDYDWLLTRWQGGGDDPFVPAPDTWVGYADIGAGNATFGLASSNPSATFECRIDGAPFTPCTSPISYTGLAEGLHRFETRSGVGDSVDPTPASWTWNVDATPPDTMFTGGPPAGTIASTSATFTFEASEANASFYCSLDGAPLDVQCFSPMTYTGLAQGLHTFRVAANDGSGNMDPTPATATWTVDTVAPETTIVSGPSGSMAATSVTLTFSSSEAGTFECRLDNAAFAICTSPITYTGLADGAHSFQVRATDGAGNVDATPAAASWTVDSTPPETVITSAPSAWTSVQTSAFTFGSNDPGAVFDCQLDGQAFVRCTSPATYSGLAEGAHVFRVRAVDAAGNADLAPAEHSWTIDLTSPDTLITSAPSSQWPSSVATATFQANEANATFECALDSVDYAACTSPATYTGLADGAHRLIVRSIDAAGNVDASPSVIVWNVDTAAPDTTITSGPQGTVSSPSATFAFEASESGATFECRLDGGGFAACSSPATYAGLAQGSHTFDVRAIDAAGNVDATPASRAWTVDATAPDTSITSGPSGVVASSAASLAFTSNEAGATFECRLDGAVFAACTSPASYSGLAQGSHTFDVRAKDAAGNIDATPATRAWSVDTVAPDTSITSGPSGTVASASATFVFTASEGGATFECRLDGAAFAACASPVSYASLAQGSHTFDVRAKDGAGNVDATPASRSWAVDSAAPDTSITSGPSGAVGSTSATFQFTASEGGATFECRLDGAAFAACTSPKSYSALAQGSHTFDVRARDALGNTDGTPASRTWTVDTVAPDTTITSGPASQTTSTSATFTFTSNEAGATFECKLDSAAFAACTTPKTYTGLSKANHTVQVRAKDAAGNLDASPASYAWRVK